MPPPDEEALALRQALFALPEKYRVALVLHVLEGYTLQETAALLAIPLGTAKTRVARSKKQLEQALGQDPSDETAALKGQHRTRKEVY